ncbi:MAG: Spy/CpxP family protein refolding chaperone [Acidobacteriota bacterium]
MKTIHSVLRAGAVAALASGLMFAQAPAAPGPEGQAAPAQHRFAGKGRRHGHGMGAKLMAGYLGLSDQQKTQAQAIFSNARTAAQPLRAQLRQARADLRAAIRDGKPVDQLAQNQGALLGKLAVIRANAAVQFRGLLTPDQIQKLDQLHPARPAQG